MLGWVEGGGEQGGVDVDGCAGGGVFVGGELFFSCFCFALLHWVST